MIYRNKRIEWTLTIHRNKLETFDENNKFLERHKVLKLIQGAILN